MYSPLEMPVLYRPKFLATNSPLFFSKVQYSESRETFFPVCPRRLPSVFPELNRSFFVHMSLESCICTCNSSHCTVLYRELYLYIYVRPLCYVPRAVLCQVSIIQLSHFASFVII